MLPAFGRLRQVDHEFKHSLGYTAKLSLKKTKQKKKNGGNSFTYQASISDK
jgi:hypothetical protein